MEASPPLSNAGPRKRRRRKWIGRCCGGKRISGTPRGTCCACIAGNDRRLQPLEGDVVSNEWFARPVLFVADIDRSVDFYVKQLGFSQPWRYEEEGKARVAQVERQGCALILSSQWPDKVGKGLMFISLDVEVLNALRAELEGRGVDVKDGHWGYRLMVIVDPDRNELYFPYPSDAKET